MHILPLLRSGTLLQVFFCLRLHRKEETQNKDLKSHWNIELGTSLTQGRKPTGCANPYPFMNILDSIWIFKSLSFCNTVITYSHANKGLLLLDSIWPT